MFFAFPPQIKKLLLASDERKNLCSVVKDDGKKLLKGCEEILGEVDRVFLETMEREIDAEARIAYGYQVRVFKIATCKFLDEGLRVSALLRR